MLKAVAFGVLVAVALAVGAQGSQAEHVFAGTYTTDSLGEPGPVFIATTPNRYGLSIGIDYWTRARWGDEET